MAKIHQHFEEIVIGDTLNDENETIFQEFMSEFSDYIVMQTSPQTGLLSEEFFDDEANVTEKMKAWLDSNGIDEFMWGFQ